MTAYTRELHVPALLKIGSVGEDVRRVQEWLNLHKFGVMIDGEFGPATDHALRECLPVGYNGAVDEMTWDLLTQPLGLAMGVGPTAGMPFRKLVTEIAAHHLAQKPLEVGGDNKGPWVRTYCRGYEVAWCQGFASTIWLQAADAMKIATPIKLFDDAGTFSLYVPFVFNQSVNAGLHQPGESKEPVPVGSMFFLRGGSVGHSHVGIVVVDHGDVVETIEGNTNDNGSANGYEVARRFRKKVTCDFGRSEPFPVEEKAVA